jgi:hypothetical protein
VSLTNRSRFEAVAVRSQTTEHLFDGEVEEVLEFVMKLAITDDAAEREL